MTDFYPSDQYGFSSLLSEGELAALGRLRAVLDEKVRLLVNEYWEKAEFPVQIMPDLIKLNLMAPEELGGAEPSALYGGFRNFEFARLDASIVTLYNAQSGLFRTTVNLGGDAEQVAELDPKIQSFELKGVFALTEPDHGSDIARGLATSARQESNGDWIINGAKRWIGGASMADVLATFARDEADGQVKCFLVPTDSEGLTISKMHGKTSLRMMQNADIQYDDVRVRSEARLRKINSFADVAACLRNMRSDVAWIATGCAAGAYEEALAYVMKREQFGRPIAGFQLIQEKLATMLANVTASLGVVVRLTQQQAEGNYRDENSALAKMFTARMLRETVALAREIMGGNGILLENNVARFHADAEAIYSYEGTDEINALVVGRAITGLGAFNR
ncbi:acyl-CoA dehydrogenase family protein [Neomicrococcus aestuarii]|uniref:Glutaryl-CoA dehydrogenase n=1 Tax=Neomicrococcus aestuarii TaxID=556325 RepID=A0A1L2ZPC8_9MICC|nr:acyl-CoA dehydrogenase family protein [Neomicrococcus aestuarii]APF41275.1 glutaryl-CoA dehydrogenase [Neomicrococcus aestuarii]